ncbi:MAG: hypothetical protein R2716_05200 [Microthrixaceae bacterium]
MNLEVQSLHRLHTTRIGLGQAAGLDDGLGAVAGGGGANGLGGRHRSILPAPPRDV